jgi:twitching motility protein PilT
MHRIDGYLRSMERFSAKSVVLTSGGHVLLRFPTGDRHATQTTPHEQLRGLVLEIAPESSRALLEAGRETRFPYSSDGHDYAIAVDPQPNRWTVTVEPASRGDDMVIEPTAHHSGQTSPAARPGPSPRPAAPPRVEEPPATHAVPPGIAMADERRSSGWIDRTLTEMKRRGSSDLHLSSGAPPYVRLHGHLQPIEGAEPLDSEWLLQQLLEITPSSNREEFAQRNDTDYGHAIPGVSRFRVNMFRDRNGPGAVFRAIPFEIPDATQLGLTSHVLELCNLTKGLVLVTGPTGSGKSTTLAAMVDHVNRTRRDHIITIEDPVEFIHANKGCLVNQREVHTHTRSFKDALRAALREDPDIVLVGELRDLETVAIAIETAETGHLVFGTLHTSTAPSTVDRIVDQFPPDRQEQIRQMLAKSLKGVISQVLCRKRTGGRVAAYEILLGSSAVENLIREHKTYQLFSVMQTSRAMGMQTMEDALLELVKSGQVDGDEAYRKAINKAEFKTMLSRAGITV